MSKRQGKNARLYVGNTVIAVAQECSYDMSTDFVETSNPLSGAAKTYRPGRTSWTASGRFLYDPASHTSLISAQASRSSLDLVFYDAVSEVERFEGTAYIENVRVSAPVSGWCVADISFRGTGVLTRN